MLPQIPHRPPAPDWPDAVTVCAIASIVREDRQSFISSLLAQPKQPHWASLWRLYRERVFGPEVLETVVSSFVDLTGQLFSDSNGVRDLDRLQLLGWMLRRTTMRGLVLNEGKYLTQVAEVACTIEPKTIRLQVLQEILDRVVMGKLEIDDRTAQKLSEIMVEAFNVMSGNALRKLFSLMLQYCSELESKGSDICWNWLVLYKNFSPTQRSAVDQYLEATILEALSEFDQNLVIVILYLRRKQAVSPQVFKAWVCALLKSVENRPRVFRMLSSCSKEEKFPDSKNSLDELRNILYSIEQSCVSPVGLSDNSLLILEKILSSIENTERETSCKMLLDSFAKSVRTTISTNLSSSWITPFVQTIWNVEKESNRLGLFHYFTQILFSSKILSMLSSSHMYVIGVFLAHSGVYSCDTLDSVYVSSLEDMTSYCIFAKELFKAFSNFCSFIIVDSFELDVNIDKADPTCTNEVFGYIPISFLSRVSYFFRRNHLLETKGKLSTNFEEVLEGSHEYVIFWSIILQKAPKLDSGEFIDLECSFGGIDVLTYPQFVRSYLSNITLNAVIEKLLIHENCPLSFAFAASLVCNTSNINSILRNLSFLLAKINLDSEKIWNRLFSLLLVFQRHLDQLLNPVDEFCEWARDFMIQNFHMFSKNPLQFGNSIVALVQNGHFGQIQEKSCVLRALYVLCVWAGEKSSSSSISDLFLSHFEFAMILENITNMDCRHCSEISRILISEGNRADYECLSYLLFWKSTDIISKIALEKQEGYWITTLNKCCSSIKGILDEITSSPTKETLIYLCGLGMKSRPSKTIHLFSATLMQTLKL